MSDRTGAPPPNIKTAPSRGYDISYEDAGAGPTVVLLPGWTMSAGDWRDAGYVDRLATRYRVLNVDPLGNGRSDKPHDKTAYPQHGVAADVVAVLDAEAIPKAVVWGYSRGSWLAATVAAEYPGRVSGVILAAGGDATQEAPPGRQPDPVTLAMANGDFEPLWNEYSFSDEDRQHDREINDPRALGAMYLAAWEFGESIDCSRIIAPALVYVGGNDEPSGDRKTADAIGAAFHVLPGLDHLQGFSEIDQVMPVVLGFLDSSTNRPD